MIPQDELLSATEIARLVGIAVHDLGVHEVRFTGGEPLTRPDLVEIIALFAAAARDAAAITTNGIGLDHKAQPSPTPDCPGSTSRSTRSTASTSPG